MQGFEPPDRLFGCKINMLGDDHCKSTNTTTTTLNNQTQRLSPTQALIRQFHTGQKEDEIGRFLSESSSNQEQANAKLSNQLDKDLFKVSGNGNQQDNDYIDESLLLEKPATCSICPKGDEHHDNRVSGLMNSLKDIFGPENQDLSKQLPAGSQIKVVEDKSDLPEIVSVICQEIVTTEDNYVTELGHLLEKFLRPIKAHYVLGEYTSLNTLSSACESIFHVHVDLLGNLQSSIPVKSNSNWSTFRHLIRCFEDVVQFFKVYSAYCTSFKVATADLQQIKKNNEAISEYILNLDRTAKVHGISVQSYLIKPIQRLCNYPLFLKKLSQYIKIPTEKERVYKLLAKMETVSSGINDDVKSDQNNRKLFDLRDRMCGKVTELLSPSRTFLFEVTASFTKLKDSKTDNVVVYLFSDILLIGKTEPYGGGLSIQKRFPLSNIVLKKPSKTCGLDDNLSIEILNVKKDTLRKHGICKRYIITCSKPIDKHNLLSSMTNAILNIIKADRSLISNQNAGLSEEESVLQCASSNYWSRMLQEVQEGKKELAITTKNNVSTATGVRSTSY